MELIDDDDTDDTMIVYIDAVDMSSYTILL